MSNLKHYTIETRINFNDVVNTELHTYLNEFVKYYNAVQRYVWYALQDKDFNLKYKSKAAFVTHLCAKFNILKRTANSIRYEVESRLKSLKALKQYEKTQLNLKIESLEAKKQAIVKTLDYLKPIVADNEATDKELTKYRETKQRLFYLQRKLNKKQMQLKQRKIALEEGKLSICFGTKQLFKAQYNLEANNFRSHEGWYNRFIKSRDKNVFYLGSKDETQGNQMMQLRYNIVTNAFSIKLRKENAYAVDSKYVEGVCDFKYQREHLKTMLESKGYPLTYRFKREGNKWYLQVLISIAKPERLTSEFNGVIGLDYNESFIALSETDKSGNLVDLQHIPIYKGTSSQTENALRTAVSQICKRALTLGKTVVIEDLDFKRNKGKMIVARSKAGKRYNRMLSSLDYSRYKETMLNTGHRLGVDVVLVSPVNTSKIGKIKYSFIRKLSVHQSASYVIGRRGQGYKDAIS